jgi:hypothetical protein
MVEHEFGFLWATDKQRGAYLSDLQIKDILKQNPRVDSNHFKQEIYNLFYDFEPRKKKTGFESFADLDQNIRTHLSFDPNHKRNVLAVREDYAQQRTRNDSEYVNASIEYAQAISKYCIAENKNPMLFYSGGIDSELMLNIFLDSGVEFDVLFADYKGANDYDKQYMLEYTAKHNITPIIMEFDVEQFFGDYAEIIRLHKEYNNSSPQILAYYKLIELAAEKYNSFPVLAGEFRINYNPARSVGIEYVNWKGESGDPECGPHEIYVDGFRSFCMPIGE